ncbi:MAG: type IX secretion system membrane protein PorP/SprF [Bacteroidales bacterium]|nr:type IX secretion system membrane protein PorP/SprF [Bacteroidales bacterium]MBN2820638.1 type IX secretion system membrane protein PorP/SprF [Bacteroidales bacterium]
MRKLIIIFIFLGGLSQLGRAQMDPLYTQFMTNPFLINPGITGTYPYYQIITNNRLQWVGMADAPLTNTISMYGPMVNMPMGVGGFIMQDRWGPESKIKITGSYAYNYTVSEMLKVSLGLNVGMFQYKMDASDLRIENKDDNYFVEGDVYQFYKPDATVGLFAWSPTYNGGIALTNLFGNKFIFADNLNIETDTTDQARSVLSRLRRHFYVHGGYKYLINHELAIEPALILRKVAADPLQMDINVRAWYGKRAWDGTSLWGGISYRTKDAVNILIGVVYQKKIEVGYSYDITINPTKVYQSGSHELMVSFKFNSIK